MFMKKPEVDVIRFSGCDVVAANALTMTWSQFGDNIKTNGKVQYNGQTYNITNSANVNSFISDLTNSGTGANGNTYVKWSPTAANQHTVSSLLSKEVKDGLGDSNWSGTYVYENGIFTKKT